MTTFDTFMAHNELDMIELRLNMLRDVVDVHVIVEAGETHSGLPKPNIVGTALQSGRFDAFSDKIVYVRVERLQGDHSWAREHFHRQQIEGYLHYNARPDDWVIVGDVDEIPYAEAVTRVIESGADAAALELALYYYNLSNRVQMGWGIGMCRWRVQQDANKIRTCQFDGADMITVPHAGVHLSYFMQPEQVVEKLNAFMHHADVARDVPRDPAWISERMHAHEDLFDRTTVLEHITPNGDVPEYMRKHADKYKAMGWLE